MPPARRSKSKATKAPGVASAPPVDALAEAAWAQADASLAEAIVEFERAEAEADAQARDEALQLAAQALNRAARRRGLSRVGPPGARVAFDPAKHDPVDGGPHEFVCILTSGVARGPIVLIKARVAGVGRDKFG